MQDIYINKIQKCIDLDMSSIFDEVDIISSNRRTWMLSTQTHRSVLDIIPDRINVQDIENKGESAIMERSKPVRGVSFMNPVTAKQTVKECKSNRVIYFFWGFCVFCFVLPYLFAITRKNDGLDNKDDIVFPYDCRLFLVSLLVGLPAYSIHLFCCSLYFCLKSPAALAAGACSMFMQIITVEYSCKSDPRYYVSFYSFCISMLSGIFSQVTFCSYICGLQSQNFVILGYSLSALISIMVLLTFLTTLSIFAFDVKMADSITFFTTTVSPVFCVLFYSISTAMTLKPICSVCEYLRGSSDLK